MMRRVAGGGGGGRVYTMGRHIVHSTYRGI